LLDGSVVTLDGLRVGGVGGIVGDTRKPGRRDGETFLRLIGNVLEQQPDVLILHEGPDDPETRSKGNADVRELLMSHQLLIICGHSPWKNPLVTFSDSAQVLNVAERAVLLVEPRRDRD